jgi:hypothetical protein
MFHRLNDKGDNSLTEIPGCPEKRIKGEMNRIYNVHELSFPTRFVL